MSEITLYIAASMDGKIARADGSVDWIENVPAPKGYDFGHAQFIEGVDVTIMGYSTYEQLLSWDIEFPYKEYLNFVVTRKENPQNNGHVEFVNSMDEPTIERIRSQSSKSIWCIGGGGLNGTLLNAKAIHEIRIFLMPVVLPDGIPLFSGVENETWLGTPSLVEHEGGVVELIYRPTYA